jgi:hypothetical protein
MAVDINGDGLIELGGTSTTQGRLRLAEDTDNGTNYVELTANAAVTTNRTVTFPDADINFTTGLGVAQGGTGVTSVGTTGNVLTSNGTAWVSQAAAAGGGDYIMQVFTTPGTWTKPAGLKAIKVTVVGGGGSGGSVNSPVAREGGGAGGGTAIEYIDAPAIPGPQPYTVAAASPAAPGPANAPGVTGNTSSFGSPAFCSATGGGGSPNSSNVRSAGGSGSGGTINIPGQSSLVLSVGPGCNPAVFGISGGSTLGFGGGANNATAGQPGANFGYGAGGVGTGAGGVGQPGGPGVIIVEEFY